MATKSSEIRARGPGGIVVRVPAKVNVYLQAGPVRDDGYHDITTVYQAISLYDELHIGPASAAPGLSMTIAGEGAERIPTDDRNLVLRAARALAAEAGIEARARFHLRKSIPVEAGLGGGSADAAAALVGCNSLWQLGFSEELLMKIGGQIGEDVPFLIHGMMAFGKGHKQPLESIPIGDSTWYWVLGIPHSGLATKDVFMRFDELAREAEDVNEYNRRLEACLTTDWGRRTPEQLAGLMCNNLEAPAISLLPDVASALAAGRAAEALSSVMTGSGSTCIFLAKDEKHAEDLATHIRSTGLFRDIIGATGPVSGALILDGQD